MKTNSIFAVLLIGTLLMGCSSKKKEETAAAAPASTAGSASPAKEYEVMNETVEQTAKVTNVDYKNRKITLDSDTVISAPPEVKNLDKIKKGDTVVVQYNDALVYSINKGGEATSAEVSGGSWSAKPGEQPQAGVKAKMKTTLVITDIDRNKPSVTLKNSAGETQTFKVLHPERLNDVKVGDAVDVTYSEAVAIKVEKKSSI